MPDESLLMTLQVLRDDYSQRQKAAANLLKALRGKSSALGKVSQIIGDYAAINADDDLLPSVQTGISAAQDNSGPLTARLNREIRRLTPFNGALKDIMNAINSDPVDVVKFSHPYELLKATDIEDERLSAVMPQLAAVLEAAQTELGFSFGRALHDALQPLGLELAGTSPHFEIGRFAVEVNFSARSAAINYGKETVIRRAPLSVDPVIKAYQTAVRVISGRTESADTWISQFYAAWDTARQKRNAVDKRANVIDCYFELVLLRQGKSFLSAPSKSTFADYSRAQFAYDLQEIAIRSQRAYNGRIVFAHPAVKNQSDSSAKSLWLPNGRGPHDGRYIGDIVFDKNV